MKQSLPTHSVAPVVPTVSLTNQVAKASDVRQPLVTRFGEAVDVRNRGTLRMGKSIGVHAETQYAPAVVRIWTDEHCRELNSHEARALAAQLIAAAILADAQNSH